jgi:hypothetical protein
MIRKDYALIRRIARARAAQINWQARSKPLGSEFRKVQAIMKSANANPT